MKKYSIIFLLFVSLGFLVGYLSYYFYEATRPEPTLNKPNLNLNEIIDFENEKEAEPITITFVGDIMVDRFIRKIAEANSYDYLFNNVREKFNTVDLVVANLEGTVTNFTSISNSDIEHERFVFTFDPLIINALVKANIKIVNIDNNHIMDFGVKGLEETVSRLNNSEVDYFGNPHDKEILYKQFDQITVAFVSYNQFINPNVLETNRLIRKASKVADHVVVYTHWGDEYELLPNQTQIDLAHQFVDSGADLIIGSHPHVVQSKEVYKNRQIYYSLGNFIFDQYFTEDVSCGAVLTFEFDRNDIRLVSEEFVKLDPANVVKFSNCKEAVKE